MFLTPADFTNKYELHTGIYDVAKLQSYIDIYEGRYLRQLFGSVLYNEFISDLDANFEPISPNFKYIFFPFYEDVTLFNMLDSAGIIEMLKGFIYFEYSKDLSNQMTPYGNVRAKAENSSVVNTLQTMIYARYNEAVTTYRAIRNYIFLNFNLPTNQAVSFSFYNAGTGYSDDLVTLVNVSGEVTVINVGNIGTGYATNNGVSTSGGSGTGLTVDYIDDGAGGILSVSVDNAGTGYVSGDVVTILDGNNDATATITTATPLQVGSGCIVQTTCNPIGGAFLNSITTPGTLYVTATGLATTGGTGGGCTVNIVDDTLGGISSLVIVDKGSGYLVGDILTVVGGGNDGTFTLLSVTNGEITNLVVVEGGVDYEVGDFEHIPGGNDDAVVEVVYVGKGHLNTFNGQPKGFNYWI